VAREQHAPVPQRREAAAAVLAQHALEVLLAERREPPRARPRADDLRTDALDQRLAERATQALLAAVQARACAA